MKLLELPLGNGQEVYISKEWLSASDEDFFLVPDEVETPGRRERGAVVDYLTSLGYNVVTDPNKVSYETFFFSPYSNKEKETIEEYVTRKNNIIEESLESTSIHPPKTIRFEENNFPKSTPSLPFVLKNEELQGGADKILIKTSYQLEILKQFYEEINEYSYKEIQEQARRQYDLGPEVEFYEDGTSNSSIGIIRINFKKRFHTDFVMQEYIETPTKFNTSLRVVTSSSKDILCSSLKYSKVAKRQDKYCGLVDRYLCNPTSPYFLNSKSIISNTVAGGKSIILEEKTYTKEEQQILLAHDIDPKNPHVPESVAEAALTIAVNCQREIGAISGMDFIYDSKTKTWKYLEQQEYPMMYTYCMKYNLPYETDMSLDKYDEFIKTQRRADIDSRLRALALAMQKKNNINNTHEKKLIR